MMVSNIDFDKLAPHAGKTTESFELLCYCIAKRAFEDKGVFTAIDGSGGDGGVEFYLTLSNGDVWGWQCKYYQGDGRLKHSKRKDTIQESLETSCRNYPKLVKWFLCLKTNLTNKTTRDGGEQEWFRETLPNQIPTNMNVELVFWGASEFISYLSKPEFTGIKPLFFGETELSMQWFSKQVQGGIDGLGQRYSSELNINLEISKYFEGLENGNKYKENLAFHILEALKDVNGLKNSKGTFLNVIQVAKGEEHFDTFMQQQIEVLEDENDKQLLALKDQYFLLRSFYNTLQKSVIEKKNIEYLKNLGKDIQDKISEIEESNYQIRDYINKPLRNKALGFLKLDYAYNSDALQKIHLTINNLMIFTEGIMTQLALKPCMLLVGEAGIGKSHLLGDTANKRLSEDKPSILLLGQHFTTQETPWTQILDNLLYLKYTKEDFLSALNTKGKILGERVIIFIDAINEGQGKYFWRECIVNFAKEIAQYLHIGLVMSIRDTYERSIFDENNNAKNEFICVPHTGFRYIDYKAIKAFFYHYKIPQPKVPLLNPEFSNPLFLKLFCQSLENKTSDIDKILRGTNGITLIINNYLDKINNEFAHIKNYDYPINANLVQKSVKSIIKLVVDKNQNYLNIDGAQAVVQSIVGEYTDRKDFLQNLIKEGVFSENRFYTQDTYKDGVYFTYQRFEDHLKVIYLLDGKTKENIISEFQEGGQIYTYLFSRYNHNREGIMEVLAIQLPEQFGMELYEVLPNVETHYEYEIAFAFIRSLQWRLPNTITAKIFDYVNEVVCKQHNLYITFLDTFVLISTSKDNILNANKLHDFLSKQSMPERDTNLWTQWIHYQYSLEEDSSTEVSSIKRLIDWAWSDEDKSGIDSETINLASITLAWFLTSSNKTLRDASTKALVSLLENHLDLVLHLLTKFEKVNDPYVYERIFAVAYGCAMRGGKKQQETLNTLTIYIYQHIFNVEGEVYPHILLRDYARNTIEYALHLNPLLNTDIEFEKIRPPYKSNLSFDNLPTVDDLKEKYKSSEYSSLVFSVLSFGDFERYVIDSAIRDWTDVRFEEKRISRKDLFNNFISTLSTEQISYWDSLDTYSHDFNEDIWQDSPTYLSEVLDSENIDIENIDTEAFLENLKSEVLSNPTDDSFSIFYTKSRLPQENIDAMYKTFEDMLSDAQRILFVEQIKSHLNYYTHSVEDNKSYFDAKLAQAWIFQRVLELGWKPELHYEFERLMGHGYENRHYRTSERIGKKYQWIAFYEFMARLSDNFKMQENQKYEGTWEPYLRNIDPSTIFYKTMQETPYPTQISLPKHNGKWGNDYKEWLASQEDLPNVSELIEVNDEHGNTWLNLQMFPEWEEKKGKLEKEYPSKLIWYHLRSYLIRKTDKSKFLKWLKDKHFSRLSLPESRSVYQIFNQEYCWSPAYDSFRSTYYEGDKWREVDKGYSLMPTVEEYLWEKGSDALGDNSIRIFKPCETIFTGLGFRYARLEGMYLEGDKNLVCFDSSLYSLIPSCLLIKKEEFVNFLQANDLEIFWTLLGEKQSTVNNENHTYFSEFSGYYYLDKHQKLIGKIHHFTPRFLVEDIQDLIENQNFQADKWYNTSEISEIFSKELDTLCTNEITMKWINLYVKESDNFDSIKIGKDKHSNTTFMLKTK